jgi:hypothetical protein
MFNMTEWRIANKEKLTAQRKEYNEINKVEIAARKREYSQANKEKRRLQLAEHRAKNPEIYAIRAIRDIYKVTPELAIQLYNRSMDTCECCKEKWDPSIHSNRFCVDHNHTTGEVRGILCHACNKSLGMLRESTAIILALADYNERYNDKQ